MNFFLLFLSYLIIFEYFFIVFLPLEFWQVNWDLYSITKKTVILIKMIDGSVASIASCACYHLRCTIVCCYHFPFQTLSIWICAMHLILCPDIHPNPGPTHLNQFAAGFLSFCNWNLNTLCKNDFTRIALLEAHNTEYNYDIISLCETSLDD